MRIVLITQNDPFFLKENIDYLLSKMPGHSQVVGCIVFDASPFGKKLSPIQKVANTIKVFGTKFLMYYATKMVVSKIQNNKVEGVLKRHKVPLIELNSSINSKESLEKIRATAPDLLISIAGNQIFKEALINLAPKGCLNLHTSLLPKYRGLMPSFWVLKNDEEYTGVSVFFVDKGIDSGPIIVQKKVRIGNMSQQQLIKHTKRLGMESILEAIDLIYNGNYQLIENDAKQMTYYSFPTAADVADFKKKGKRFF